MYKVATAMWKKLLNACKLTLQFSMYGGVRLRPSHAESVRDSGCWRCSIKSASALTERDSRWLSYASPGECLKLLAVIYTQKWFSVHRMDSVRFSATRNACYPLCGGSATSALQGYEWFTHICIHVRLLGMYLYMFIKESCSPIYCTLQ